MRNPFLIRSAKGWKEMEEISTVLIFAMMAVALLGVVLRFSLANYVVFGFMGFIVLLGFTHPSKELEIEQMREEISRMEAELEEREH